MTHVMVDIETLGTAPGSAIVSIGACRFDPKTKTVVEDHEAWCNGDSHKAFYTTIKAQSCLDEGLTVSGGTIEWWMGQSDEARQVFRADPINMLHITDALISFSCWLADQRDIGGTGELSLWGNGANFDNVLLRAAFEKCDIEPSWKFYEDRCYRTLKCLLPRIPLEKRTGTHHNALDDAITQAHHCNALLRALPVGPQVEARA